MRQDDLNVGFCSECAGLEKRLLVVDTTAINILTSSDVVQCVGDTVKVAEERVTVDICSEV